MSLKIVKKSVIYTTINLFGSVLSLAINSIIAVKFGASYLTDGFLLVLGFYQLIIVLFKNTFGTVFIPYFVSIKESHSEEEAWKFSSLVFNSMFFLTLAISLVLIIFSQPIIKFIAMGYSQNEVALDYLNKIFRYFFIFLLFSNLSTVCTAILVAKGRILYASFYIVIQNTISLIITVLFEKYFGIFSLTYGYILGSGINFIVYFNVFSTSKRYTLSLKFRDSFVIDYYKKLLPWLFSSLITKISPVLERMFATLSVVGGVMFIDFAQKLLIKSVGVISMGVSISSYSDITRHIVNDDITNLKKIVSFSFKLILLLTIPILLMVMFLREEIALILFNYGKMDYQSVKNIAMTMIGYSLGVFLLNIIDLIRKIIFSYKKLLFISIMNITQLIINTMLIILLMKRLSFMSIPVAYSITLLLVFLSLLYYLRRLDPRLRIEGLWVFFTKLIAVSLIMLVCLYSLKIFISFIPSIKENKLVNILISILMGGVVFIIFSKLFHLSEVTEIFSKVRIKIEEFISGR